MPTTLVTDALTTRQKVKDYLDIADTTHDTVIDELINYTTQFIKSYCGGREFLNQSYTETYDSIRGRRKIFLKQMPVTAVSAVSYRSGTPTNVVWVTYNADGYLTYLKEGYIHFYAQLPEVSQGLRVQYTAGFLIDFTHEFDTTYHTLPQDVTFVATELTAKFFNTRKSMGILQESTEGQSISYSYKSREIDDAYRTILSKYTIFRVAS